MDEPKPYSLEEVRAGLEEAKRRLDDAKQRSASEGMSAYASKYAGEYDSILKQAEKTANALRRENLQPILYIKPSTFDLPPPLLVSSFLSQLDVGKQKRQHDRATVGYDDPVFAELAATAEPKPELLDETKRILDGTRTGKFTIACLELYQPAVRFAFIPPDAASGMQSEYHSQDNSIIVAQRKNEGLDTVARRLVYAVRQNWQHENFPEFAGSGMNAVDRLLMTISEKSNLPVWQPPDSRPLSVIDRFVGMKLSVLDCIVAEATHMHALGSRNIRLVEAINGRSSGNLQSLLPQGQNVGWSFHECAFDTEEMTDTLRAGGFKRKVGASPLLHRDFLKRFAVDPGGTPYVLEHPGDFRNKLINEISRLYHPLLIEAADAGRSPNRNKATDQPRGEDPDPKP